MKTPSLLFSLPLLLTCLATAPAFSQESTATGSTPKSTVQEESSELIDNPLGLSPAGELTTVRIRGKHQQVEVITDQICIRRKDGTEQMVRLSGKRSIAEADLEATRLQAASDGNRADLVICPAGMPKDDRHLMLLTRRVSVQLKEGVTPSVFAQTTAAIRAQRVSFAPEALILTYPTAGEAVAAVEDLLTRPEVVDAEVVVAMKHHVESIPGNVQYFSGGGPSYAIPPQTDNVDGWQPPAFLSNIVPTAAYQWWANNIPTLVGPRNSTISRVDLGDFPPVGYNPARPGVHGELADVRLPVAWDNPGDFGNPISGRSRKILIVDDGIQKDHPDLAQAVDLNNERHYNFFNDTKNPSPVAGDPHGTSLAGIAGARLKNVGSRITGVAPGCIFHSAIAARGFVDDLDWAQAFVLGSTLVDSDGDNDYLDEDRSGVVNFEICLNASSSSASGDALNLYPESWLWKRAIRFGATRARALSGVIYVTSAGNGGDGHMNTNYLENKNSIYQIPVAGVSDLGRRIASSNEGANIVCSAPTWGNELPPFMNWPSRPAGFPTNRPFKKNAPIGPDDLPAAWRRTTQAIPTITIGNGINFDFTGTSASAAMVAGVAALMLEANPNLTARDVKEILLRSSRTLNDVRVTYDSRVADTQWRMGRLGRPLSHVYGAGLVDANKAVQMAKRWPKLPTNPLPPIKLNVNASNFGENISSRNTETGGLYYPVSSSLLIPTDGRAIEVIVPSPPSGMRIEHIEVRVQLYHGRRGDLEIKLIAPAEVGWETGRTMESELFVPHRDDYTNSRWDNNPDLRDPTDWTFATVRHWGTRTGVGGSGKWLVRIRDASSAGANTSPSANDPVFVPVGNPTNTQSQRLQGIGITYHGVYSQTPGNDAPTVTGGKLRYTPGTAPVKSKLTHGPLFTGTDGSVSFPITNWDIYNPVDIVPLQPSNTPRDFFEFFPPSARLGEDANELMPVEEFLQALGFPRWPLTPPTPLEPPAWIPFPLPNLAPFIVPPVTDAFALPGISPLIWTEENQGLESTANSGLTATVAGGQLTLGGTATTGPWAGKSLRTVQTYSTSINVSAAVDRVSLAGTGTGHRSSLWLWGDAGHYLHFSQNPVDGGWTFNANDDGGTGTLTPTGTGTNLPLLDFADNLTDLANMRLVWIPGNYPGEGSIEMWHGTTRAMTHKVTKWPSSMRVMITGQAAAAGDTVAAVFDNLNITTTGKGIPTSGGNGGLTIRPGWGPNRTPVELSDDLLWMVLRDPKNANPATNFVHVRLNRAHGELEVIPFNRGVYSLHITAESMLGISSPKLHELTVALPTYAGWADTYWDEPELSNPNIAGFCADPDNDGVYNGLEFAMRMTPNVADPGPIPPYRIEGNEVIFNYQQDTTAELQVTLHAQVSDDLQTWTDITPIELGVANGLRDMEVRISTTDPKRFFRLWAEPLVPVLK